MTLHTELVPYTEDTVRLTPAELGILDRVRMPFNGL